MAGSNALSIASGDLAPTDRRQGSNPVSGRGRTVGLVAAGLLMVAGMTTPASAVSTDPALPTGQDIGTSFNSTLADNMPTTIKASVVMVGVTLIKKYIWRAGDAL